MATKGELFVQFSKSKGPLYGPDEDEPIFVLRAQDKFFVPIVRLWVELVEMDAKQPISEDVSRKILDAVEIANRALDWQAAHADRVKVPD